MSTFNGGPQGIVTNGLVLYLDAANHNSYISGSTIWNDLSRSRLIGTLLNGPTFNSSNGGSIVFDGSNDVVNLGSTNDITGNNLQNLTVSIWLKYSVTTTDLRAFTLSRASGGTNSSLFGIYCNANTPIGTGIPVNETGALGFFTRTPSNSFSSLTFNDNYHLKNRFINVVCVVDGTNRHLYIDGELKNSDTIGMLSVSNNTDTAYIGSGPAGAGQLSWNGAVSSLGVYRQSLSLREIVQNYNSMKARFGL